MNAIRWKTSSSNIIPYRPAKLLRWHAGIGVELQGETAREYLSCKDYHETQHGVTVGVSQLTATRIQSIGWIGNMLRTHR